MPILLHPRDGLRRPIDPARIYYCEARDGDTLIKLRTARPRLDVRRLGQLERLLRPHKFIRIHRNYLINPAHILEIRRRPGSRDDWSLKLAPPVNKVLPISRSKLKQLWAAFGER